MAYYEIIFGSGTYACYRYIAKTDYPTTDYGALIDALIDYGREKGYGFVATNYECFDDDGSIIIDDWEYQADEYVIGGNYGDALLHLGELRINEISEGEIGTDTVLEVVE